MSKLFQQNASAPLPKENLFNNLDAAKKFFSDKSQFFESTEMKKLFASFKEKNIKETQLNQMDKMKKMTVASIDDYLKVLNITELRLMNEWKSNEQQIEVQIKEILSNNQHKSELRKLASRHVQLLSAQKQLVEAFSEEKINEKCAKKFKSSINAEVDRFYTEPVRELYRRDFQAILEVGLTASDLAYLGELSQLDQTIRQQAGDKIADYYMQAAEAQIAQNSYVTSQTANDLIEKNIVNNANLTNGALLYENESMSALYTADTVDRINELVLNGADPVKESQELDSTPLAQHFASRYILQQELNRVSLICIPSLKAQLNPKNGKKVLFQQFLKDKNQLKTDLNNKIGTLNLEIKRQPQLKMDFENHIQAVNKEAKQQKCELKNELKNQIKALKKKTKALTPESKIELSYQLEQLKTEEQALNLELKNNAALIDAHIKAIVLRDVDAPVSDYPDIAGKKEFQQTWNNCKQEIKALKHTQLAENCSAYNFLTQDLDRLPTLEEKTLESVIKHFPEYKPLLQMQNDLLKNYRLVQGPPSIVPTTKLRSVIETSNHMVKAPVILETYTAHTSEQPGLPLNDRTRLNSAAIFNASFQSKSPTEPKKTSEHTLRSLRLNGSLFFSLTNASSNPTAVKEKSIDKTICYANS